MTRNLPSSNIWSYWEGPVFPLLSLCIESMQRHNPSARLLNETTFHDWRGNGPLPDFKDRCIAHKSDWLRFRLLREHGGLWVDADCIVMKPLQPVLDLLPLVHLAAYDDGHGKNYGCGFLLAPKGGHHITDIDEAVTRRMMDPRPLHWLELTDGSIKDIVLKYHEGKGFLKLDRNMFEPVSWNGSWDAFFERAPDRVHEARFNPTAFTYMLSNNSLGDRAKKMTRQQLLEGDYFISYVLRKALGVS